jgi:hypothetical protein
MNDLALSGVVRIFQDWSESLRTVPNLSGKFRSLKNLQLSEKKLVVHQGFVIPQECS